jgi:hypothetical protein
VGHRRRIVVNFILMVIVMRLRWLERTATFVGDGVSGRRLVVGSNIAGGDVVSWRIEDWWERVGIGIREWEIGKQTMEILKNGRETKVFVVGDWRILVQIWSSSHFPSKFAKPVMEKTRGTFGRVSSLSTEEGDVRG